MRVPFGIFDHVDRGEGPLAALYESRLRLVEAADAAGFRTYHVAEHHATSLGMAPSPGIFLAALAKRTRRIRFGPLVYILPLYPPLRLIEEICMLDQLSGGRFELGVGRGISPYELAYNNVDFLEAAEIYEEALQVIVAGLSNEEFASTLRVIPFPFTSAEKGTGVRIWHPSLSSLWEWGRVNPLVGSACDRFGLVPRLGAGECWCGVGSRLDREVDPRSGLGLDADPVRRRLGAPGTGYRRWWCGRVLRCP